MDWITSHIGEINALGTAAIWGVAVILFRKSGETVHPLGLNLFKNVLAMLLLLPTIWLFGESLFYPAPWQDYALLLISGALGIAVSDTLFFKSLNALGAGLSAIVDCLYSPFIIGLSMLWLGERLRPLQVLGALMIISAVLAATTESRGDKADRKRILLGILWGALAMATMAVAIVIVKPLLEDTPLLWATEWRIIGVSLSSRSSCCLIVTVERSSTHCGYAEGSLLPSAARLPGDTSRWFFGWPE
jgi:drug/metabolite transporter (DMT)-like permease